MWIVHLTLVRPFFLADLMIPHLQQTIQCLSTTISLWYLHKEPFSQTWITWRRGKREWQNSQCISEFSPLWTSSTSPFPSKASLNSTSVHFVSFKEKCGLPEVNYLEVFPNLESLNLCTCFSNQSDKPHWYDSQPNFAFQPYNIKFG